MVSAGSTTTTPSWTAMALFVVTILASQLLQNFLKDNEEEDDDRVDVDRRRTVSEEFDRYAWTRRRCDRLSFDHTEVLGLPDRATIKHPRRATTMPPLPSKYAPGNKRLSVANNDNLHNEPDNELLPKNFNWSHFESTNEDDINDSTNNGATAEGFHSPLSSSRPKELPSFTQLQKPEIGRCASDNMEESAYSKEQFVWTAPPTRSKFAQQAETPSDHRRSAPVPFASLSTQLDGSRQCEPGERSDTRRRRSLQVSLRDPDDRSKAAGAVPHFSDIGPPKRLRRSTISVPEYLRIKKLRRYFSLESSDDGDLSHEDVEEEEEDQEEESAEVFRTMNREARARYNARIMPSKVVLIRHGQSMGNIDEFLYSTTPDNAMPLTKLGWEQARYTGRVLKEQVLASEGNKPVHFIVSPYVRTVETFHGIVSAWCDPAEFSHIENRDERLTAWYEALVARGLTWHEDPRIREQDFGNYQDPEAIKKAKQERHRFGVFYYRFPHGESASDVFDRVSTFLDSLWRSFDFNQSRNYVLITHGISIRVFLARYFRYTIDQFSMLLNPRNCEMVILGHDGAGKLNLEGRCDLEMKANEETQELEVVGHKFHKRLRVLPHKCIRKSKIRICYDDEN